MIVQRILQKIIEDKVKLKATSRKIIILYGARQVGKTTLVKKILSRIHVNKEYFNCDYFDIQSLFSYENTGNLESIVGKYDLIVLDEAQRIKNIGLVLKILHDEFPHLQVIATGSSSFDLSNKINEPLTGRKIVYRLFPFSFPELNASSSSVKSARLVNRILRFGSYPSVILQDDSDALINLNEIASSYLFKDIMEFHALKKPEILLDLLKLLSFQISNEVSYTEIAGKLRVDQTVIQRYIQLLEESFIIFRLPALKKNLRNEIGKSRKIYFWDIGIRNALIQNTNSLDFRNDEGALWENFCVSERLKYLNYLNPLQYKQFFWRTYGQKEIDYIEEKAGQLNAFEFKWASTKKDKMHPEFRIAYPDSTFRLITPGNFENELFKK